MFELLTKKQKKEVINEYRLRKVIVATIFITITAVVGSLLLVPALILSSSKAKDLESRVQVQNKTQETKDVLEIRKSIISVNKQLTLLQNRKDFDYVEKIEEIVEARTPGMELISFTIRDNPDSGLNIFEVGGIAPTRDSLLLFVKRLEQKEFFESVELPISNFAKDQNIPFSLKANIVYEE